MAKIPLYKFAQKEFPMTPRSTVHYWVKMAYFKNEGPLAGRVERLGGRWYVVIPSDPTTEKILAQVKTMLGKKS